MQNKLIEIILGTHKVIFNFWVLLKILPLKYFLCIIKNKIYDFKKIKFFNILNTLKLKNTFLHWLSTNQSNFILIFLVLFYLNFI